MNARQAARRVVDLVTDRLALHDSYRRVFDPSSPDAQKVLQHLCKAGFVFDSSFVAGDPHRTSFNEGKRHLMLSLLRFVNRSPEELRKQIETQYDDHSL